MPARSLRVLLVATGLLITTNGLVFFVAHRVLEQPVSWESPFAREIFLALAAGAIGAVVLDPLREAGRMSSQSRIATVAIVWFAGWTLVSSLWSLSPDLTRGRAMIYIGLAAFAWVVADLTFDAWRSALLLATGACVGASLAAVALSHSIGLDKNDDWRGIFTNRNSLAPVAGVAILMATSVAIERQGRRRSLAIVVGLLAAVAMLGSGSRTAWLALFAAAGAALVITAFPWVRARWGTRGMRALQGATLIGAGVVTAAVVVLWNEPTFGQRRTIWSLVWDRIGERPLHGFGWFNVWGVPEFVAADELLQRGSAHGSFLEVWLGVGLVGLIPFLVIVGLALYGTTRDAIRDPSVASWTWLALVLFLVIENLTESFVLWFSYNWVLLMVAALRSGVGWRRSSVERTPAAQPKESSSVA